MKQQIEVEIMEVWGTIDKDNLFPYVNIYENEEEARKEIGTEIDCLEIVDVKKGWFITGTEISVENDFYESYREAKEHLVNIIIPIHEEGGYKVVEKRRF